jgi:tRNA-dihydrouridine synthase A
MELSRSQGRPPGVPAAVPTGTRASTARVLARLDRRLCVAPMMDRTDRHERHFLRLLSRRVLLYTEMITTGALLYGDRERFLAFDPREHPVALQLGGSEPAAMAACARMAEEYGYDEVNINVGCPSRRVRSGAFGACLMAEPEAVAACVDAMGQAVQIPVTVKTRIGIDERDSYEHLYHFVSRVAEAGCRTFILHARKAWLNGLSPKANRTVPPLRYEMVYRLKQELPALEIVLNGGVRTLDEAHSHLGQVDGVMIGREAYQNPYLLAEADSRIFGESRAAASREEILEAFIPYVVSQLAQGERLHRIIRHILGLYQGIPGAKTWRRHLSEHAHRPGGGAEIIRQALAEVIRKGQG